MKHMIFLLLAAGLLAACGPATRAAEGAEPALRAEIAAEPVAELAAETAMPPASAPAALDTAARPAALQAGQMVAERRNWIGALLAEPTDAALAQALRKVQASGGREPWQDEMELPVWGSSGLMRPESVKVSVQSYGYADSTYSSARLVLPEGGEVDLPSHGFNFERSALGVYGLSGTRADISPVEGFPLWIDLAETNGRITLQYFPVAEEIAQASFIQPLPGQTVIVHVLPEAGSEQLLEITEAQTALDDAAPVYTIFPMGEVSADGEWVKVQVNYAVDPWCGGEALQPDVDGWIRWRGAREVHGVFWQARYSC